MTDEQFLSEVKRTVLAIDPQAEIWLFGSRARGDFRDDSDWDFLVLTDEPANRTLTHTIRDQLYDVELASRQLISTLVHQKGEWEDLEVTDLYQNIKDDGRQL
ncbi:nucleotidyltransferase domain-containing protein [Spirosoma rhododendri]|uniref:Nucleotidyltransferase domain-containing protein n=1 Tax=Spirosoma rhododendri TaxID=2728024 RepID=A0A7L5DLD9_9BACT|nr:nucleotidyltransferase domain-containing protein [Spirosoma rhododendri]QJD78003.1 nucleotidyltransferase domain-containing protein [Spirosoma rhododendri]